MTQVDFGNEWDHCRGVVGLMVGSHRGVKESRRGVEKAAAGLAALMIEGYGP